MTQLHSAEDAIKQAIEAGYKNGHIWGIENGRYILLDNTGQKSGSISKEQILQDPAFWRALSVARGWDKICSCGWLTRKKYIHYDAVGSHKLSSEWQHIALQYFSTLLSEGDITKFWESVP